MKVGFIGLGIMGAPMALHLLDAGHQLFVHTRSQLPASVAASTGLWAIVLPSAFSRLLSSPISQLAASFARAGRRATMFAASFKQTSLTLWAPVQARA